MKTIALLRHAKSDWTDSTLMDIDRPLSARGQKDAPIMGDWLSAQSPKMEHALVSPAQRAQETFAGLGIELPHEIKERLYPTQAGNVLRLSKALPEELNAVLMVGHNPGISGAVEALLYSTPDDPKLEDMPTASCAILQFDVGSWAEIEFGSGKLLSFMTPKRLKA